MQYAGNCPTTAGDDSVAFAASTSTESSPAVDGISLTIQKSGIRVQVAFEVAIWTRK